MARLPLPLLLAAALVLLPSAPTGAADVDAVGWWWRAQTGIIGVPAPPNVPEGGLAVGTAPDGATAIGGVRFVLTDETPLTLTLTVADQQGIASLVACPSSVRWSPAHAGPWPSRPGPACDLGEAPGELSEDGATWSFDVSGFPAVAVLDAIIVPAGDPGAFQVSFEPPDATALATRSTTPPPPVAPGGPERQPQPQPEPTQAPAAPPPPAPAPRPGTAVPLPAPPAEAQPQPQPQAPVVADPEAPIAPPPPPGDTQPVAVSQEELDERDRRGALTAAAALLVMTAMVLWSSRRMGEPVGREAGLGRFTAPRTGAPPPLI